FYGGRKITGFKPVTDQAVLKRLPAESRSKVMQCDLKAKGITDYGELKVRGFGQQASPPTLELYFDGKPMTLSRWPNEGFVGIRKLIDGGSKEKGTPAVFEYESDRHGRWTEAKNAWLFGYFHFLWADATIKVGSIDTAARTITTAEPYHYGGRGMNARQGIIYYAFNLLEEIDTPGEWYLDRDRGVLYFYPPSDPSRSAVEIGMMSKPMITMKGVSTVRVEGLVFDLARYNCILMEDSVNCLVAGCTVSRMAGSGITIRGGTDNGILGCDIHTIGRRASEVKGGDRATLTPAGHFVENCRIHFFGRIDRTYTPAIQLEGVGNRVAHNLMYNCPSSVMRIEGNDHVIEFNDIHSAVRESDDQGAVDIYRNATYRGIVFRYNRFRNVGKSGSETAVHGQAGIRLDDAISGMLVYGNIFERSANGNFGAVQMNSGRDNVIDNNLFIDCRQGISGGWRLGNKVWQTLIQGEKLPGFYTGPLYLSRYPAIGRMLKEPAVNHLWRNVFYRCGQVVSRNGGDLEMLENGVFPDTDPGFVDAAAGDVRLKPGAPLFNTVGFRPIPVEEIGLYNDRYRTGRPLTTPPMAMPDWRSASD
ncbi:right-handed parallel beta-helix repeat-containing protein, partial [Planctomycetota bacterium]